MKRNQLLAFTTVLTLLGQTATTIANAAITDGAKYYYTIDGSDPATSKTRIEWTDTSAAQTIVAPDTDEEATVTVKVVAIKDGYANSNVVEKTVTFAAKKGLSAPILDPNTSQIFPNRDTDNYFDIKNKDDDGVNYYYTIDGTSPTKENGILVEDKAICLNGPDTDAKTTYNLKVVAEKNNEYSAVTSLRITYSAGTNSGTSGGAVNGTIDNPDISFSKSTPFNRQTGIKAYVLGKKSGVNYYYTTDGSEPTTNSPKLSTSYIDINAPDTDEETDVIVWVKGFKDGYDDEISSVQSITFGAKKQNIFNVTFKDRTYNDIQTIEYNAGESILSKAPTAPTIDGYEFIGWSNEDANVNRDMIIRAMYEKQQQDVEVHNPTETVILAEEGTNEGDKVLITNSWPGTLVRVYTDATADTPYFDGVVGSDGECLIDVGNLTEQGGSVWVCYDTSAAKTKNATTEEIINESKLSKSNSSTISLMNDDIITAAVSEVLVNESKLAGTSKGFTPRKQVTYPSRAVAQIYSLPIPSSRLALENESKLLVRGIIEGETVNVYDKDNILIGTAKQGKSPLLEIELSKSVNSTNVYVARVTPGRLESQQTELDKTALTNNNLVQSLSNVKQQIETAFNSSSFDASTKSSAVDAIIEGAIAFNNATITGVQSNYSNKNAHITVDILLSNTDTGDTLSFTLDKDFTKVISNSITGNGSSTSTGEKSSDVLETIKDALQNGTYDKNTGSQEIYDSIKDLVGSDTIIKIEATNNSNGNIHVGIEVTDASGVTSKDEINLSYITSNVSEVLELIKEFIKKQNYDNTVNADKILEDISDLTLGLDTEIQVTDDGKGNLTIDITLTDSSNNKTNGSITINYDYIKDDSCDNNGNNSNGSFQEPTSANKVSTEYNSEDKYVNKVAENIEDYLNKYKPNNESEEASMDEILQSISKATTSAGVTVNIADWNKTESTTTNKGILQFIVNIFNDFSDSVKITFDKFIDKLSGSNSDTSDDIVSDFDKAINEVKSYLNNLSASNSSKKSIIASKIENICSKYNVNSSIKDWNLKESTRSKKGNLSFIVRLEKDDNVVDIEYDKAIRKKSSSSSSSSSNSSTNTSSSSNSTDNSASFPIGNVGNPATSTDENGNKITISEVTNNKGEITGNKVTSTNSGRISISVGGGNGSSSVVAVYKYEPITGKYIKLPEGFVINGGYVQFTAEASSEYFVAKQELSEELVLKEGWNTVNTGTCYLEGLNLITGWKQIGSTWYFIDSNYMRVENNWKLINNKWYYLGENGVMCTGWLFYNNNWYYLNPWSGDMATGWKQVGRNWYYLHLGTGAMETGWKQLYDGWYYLHEDGHMAKAEVIDGYTIGTQGRWIY